MRFRIAGYEFGQDREVPHPVRVRDFSSSGAAVRSSDTERMAGDGVVPGMDLLGANTWAIECSTDASDMVAARDRVSEMKRIWQHEGRRTEAARLVPLDYKLAGDDRWRRVLGRPRHFAEPTPDIYMLGGLAKFGAEFEVMDHRIYAGGADGLQQVSIGQVADSTGGGWTFPISFPVTTGAVSGTRTGAITVGGDVTTPAEVTFYGPGSRLVLRGSSGWHVGLRSDVTLAHDESITLDPVAGTVIDNWGRNRAGVLDRRTPLDSVELDPGGENIFFSAVDETRSASATIRWRDAHIGI